MSAYACGIRGLSVHGVCNMYTCEMSYRWDSVCLYVRMHVLYAACSHVCTLHAPAPRRRCSSLCMTSACTWTAGAEEPVRPDQSIGIRCSSGSSSSSSSSSSQLLIGAHRQNLKTPSMKKVIVTRIRCTPPHKPPVSEHPPCGTPAPSLGGGRRLRRRSSCLRA